MDLLEISARAQHGDTVHHARYVSSWQSGDNRRVMYAGKIVKKAPFSRYSAIRYTRTHPTHESHSHIEMDRKREDDVHRGSARQRYGLPGALFTRGAHSVRRLPPERTRPVFGEGSYAACYLAEKEAKTGGAK